MIVPGPKRTRRQVCFDLPAILFHNDFDRVGILDRAYRA